MMIVRPTDSTWALMQNLIVSALDEDERPEAGSQTVLAKLSELMFVQTLRHYIETLSEDSVGWISGLRDERVGAVLRLIHTRPAEPLTLDKLAKEAGKVVPELKEVAAEGASSFKDASLEAAKEIKATDV